LFISLCSISCKCNIIKEKHLKNGWSCQVNTEVQNQIPFSPEPYHRLVADKSQNVFAAKNVVRLSSEIFFFYFFSRARWPTSPITFRACESDGKKMTWCQRNSSGSNHNSVATCTLDVPAGSLPPFLPQCCPAIDRHLNSFQKTFQKSYLGSSLTWATVGYGLPRMFAFSGNCFVSLHLPSQAEVVRMRKKAHCCVFVETVSTTAQHFFTPACKSFSQSKVATEGPDGFPQVADEHFLVTMLLASKYIAVYVNYIF